MPTVNSVVNILDENMNLVTLMPGDEVPEWALSKFKTDHLFVSGESTVVEDAAGDDSPTGTDLSKLKRAELVELCKARGLDTSGNKADLIARLEGPEVDEPVDVWGLDEDELRALANELGIDVSAASSQVELATVIEQARG